MIPFEKFKSLPETQSYLRVGINMKKLDDIAQKMSDNEFAERMVKVRSDLFEQISCWDEHVAGGHATSTSPITPRIVSGSFFD